MFAEVSSQVESFWQELFDGTAYSSGFLSSLSNLTDLQQELQIPESGLQTNSVDRFPAFIFAQEPH